jgi:hypothetical protein
MFAKRVSDYAEVDVRIEQLVACLEAATER